MCSHCTFLLLEAPGWNNVTFQADIIMTPSNLQLGHTYFADSCSLSGLGSALLHLCGKGSWNEVIVIHSTYCIIFMIHFITVFFLQSVLHTVHIVVFYMYNGACQQNTIHLSSILYGTASQGGKVTHNSRNKCMYVCVLTSYF